VTVRQQDKPSLTTLVPAAKLDWASLAISALRKPLTTCSFRRFGWRSRLVSTAATNGVLPAAPRPRLPPERSPPRYASSSSTRPDILGLPASRSTIAVISFCFISHFPSAGGKSACEAGAVRKTAQGRRLAHTQSFRQFDRTDPALGLRQLVDRAKPRDQRQLGAVENRARRETRLMLAGVALDMLPALHPRILLTTTPLAGEATPPAHLEQHRQALLLRPEPRAKRRLAQPRTLAANFMPVPPPRDPKRLRYLAHPRTRIMDNQEAIYPFGHQ